LRRLKAPQDFTLNIQIDNVLNSRAYTALGSVTGSSLFGQPIDALSGRSVRFSLSFN
jgi:outer membrane receptor protein involved in Fe transport